MHKKCHLFGTSSTTTSRRRRLTWPVRHWILRDVVSALLYLHEGWESVVLHRDVKASNVLLDANMSARLGDFGLAKLHERGANPSTTRVWPSCLSPPPSTARSSGPAARPAPPRLSSRPAPLLDPRRPGRRARRRGGSARSSDGSARSRAGAPSARRSSPRSPRCGSASARSRM